MKHLLIFSTLDLL